MVCSPSRWQCRSNLSYKHCTTLSTYNQPYTLCDHSFLKGHLLIIMNSDMCNQVTLNTESPSTHFTLIRLISCVSPHVSSKVHTSHELIVTHIIIAGFRSCMSSHMSLKNLTGPELLITHITLVECLLCASSCVSLKHHWF